jgi:hypothetical protein
MEVAVTTYLLIQLVANEGRHCFPDRDAKGGRDIEENVPIRPVAG